MVGGPILLCYASFRNVCLDTKNCGGGDWMSQSGWGHVRRSAFSHAAEPCMWRTVRNWNSLAAPKGLWPLACSTSGGVTGFVDEGGDDQHLLRNVVRLGMGGCPPGREHLVRVPSRPRDRQGGRWS